MSARPGAMVSGAFVRDDGEYLANGAAWNPETEVRDAFNAVFDCQASAATPIVGGRTATHPFALFDAGRVIGAIVAAPWRDRAAPEPGASPGQDRAAAELLWLTLWEGPERRVLVVTDLDMAQGLITRFHGCYVPADIDVLHFDIAARSFYLAGRVGAD